MEQHHPTLRGLRILELVDAHPEGLKLSEIAELLALPKGTISPIVKTLAAAGYIRQEGTLYRIGPRAFELGLSFASGATALSIIRREMYGIVEEVGEICQMGILSGRDVYYLLKEDANTLISIVSGVGKRVPAHVTGLGKALLSGMTDDEVRALYQDYSFVPYTERSLLDVNALIGQLRQVRLDGMAYENGESAPDICCVAVPLEENGQIKAAISVTAPSFRCGEEKRQRITALLLRKKQLIEESCRVQNCHLDF